MHERVHSLARILQGEKDTERVEGALVPQLTALVGAVSARAPKDVRAAALGGTTSDGTAVPIDERLKALLNKDRVMLFMKGSPAQPRCGFSRQARGDQCLMVNRAV